MKKVLITGGMGFIGNHLAYRLLSMGMDVMILDKSAYKPLYHKIDAAQIIEGDVLSSRLIKSCLAQVDTCFHLAALASIPLCHRDWIFSHQNNVLAFNELLESARSLDHRPKIIYASSAAVYGNSQQFPLTESSYTMPVSSYGADKLSNELYASVMQQLYGIHSVGLRFFNVYGPGQLASNPYSGVISRFKEAIFKGKPLTIFGNGQQTRDFVYIDDVVEALILSGQKNDGFSGIYNVCGGEAISIEAMANLMIKLTNHKHGIIHEPERQGDMLHSLGSPTLANKKLGFKARISMEEGLNVFLNAPFLP